MPYCYKCGKEVNKTAGFCSNCGADRVGIGPMVISNKID